MVAAEAVKEARAVEAQAVALVAVTALPHSQRAHLQRARLLLLEAEGLLREGEIVLAQERAGLSRAELREALGPALEAAERYTSREQVATWRRWIDETRAWSRSTGQPAVLVLKEKNVLVLLSKGAPVATYDAEVGSNALGVKQRQGDRATPEGRYRVVKKKDRGQSRYYRALLLDYPNDADRQRFAAAQRRGEIPRGERIGGLIEIHGDGGRGQNWTEGCVALVQPRPRRPLPAGGRRHPRHHRRRRRPRRGVLRPARSGRRRAPEREAMSTGPETTTGRAPAGGPLERAALAGSAFRIRPAQTACARRRAVQAS